MYTNAQSINNKLDELTVLADDLKPDFILLTECWTNPNIENASLRVPGYVLDTDLRKDRLDTGNGVGGGLLVYMKEGRMILPYNKFSDNSFNQQCGFNIGAAGSPLNILLVYRPPTSGAENTEKLCSILENLDPNTLVIGDFNMPGIDWTNFTADVRGKRLVEVVEEEGLEQLVDFATHTKGNMLDLIITNCGDKIISVEDAGKLGRSDHCILMIEIGMDLGKNMPERKCMAWNRADWDGMRDLLRQSRWSEILRRGTVDEAWGILAAKITAATTTFVPTVRSTNLSRPKWMNRELLRLVRQKRRAWKTFKSYGTFESLEKYKKLEKDVVKKVRNAKRKMEKEIANTKENNNKKFTSYIKSKTKSKSTIGPLRNTEGQLITDDRGMADELNKYFSSVFTIENLENIPILEQETENRLETINISWARIRRQIKNLRTGSAPGPDGISTQVLKELQEEFLEPLSIIYERSIQETNIPAGWKRAVVIPVFKKGTKGDPGNYRPVSLTSIPCKMMESIIKEDMMKFFEDNNLVKDTQHGFMRGKSCTTNLLEFMEKLTSIIDKGSQADVFYLHFAKAFDKVPHERLMRKLEAKGVSGKLLAWIGAWLKGRTQLVRVGLAESEYCNVSSGIPQGTVLGPPLFIVFIDDLDEAVAELDILLKFADDTKGAKEIKSEGDCEILQKTLDGLVDWANKWAMRFNVKKCKILHLGHNNPGYKYKMGEEELQVVEEERDIGIIVHKGLKPAKQCQKAAITASTVLRQITKNFHYRDARTYKNLYCQYVRPHMEFAAPAWAPWSVADVEVLEKVQKKAIGMMVGLKGRTYEDKCREIGLDKLSLRRKMADLTQVYKIMHNIDRVDRSKFFVQAAVASQRETRQNADPMNIKAKRARLDIRKYSFSVRVVEDWNVLRPEVKNAPSLNSFKTALKNLYRSSVEGAAAGQ